MPRRVLRALVCAALLFLVASPVLAHSELESASPGAGDVVTDAPAELVANFSQDLDPARTSLEVRDASGARIARGGELGDGPREFRLELPELQPGVYEVRWTSYSAEDSEIGRDSYTFEVVAAASPTPSPTVIPRPSESPSQPSPSPTPTPSAAVESPTPSPGAGSGSAGIESVLLPVLVALGVVGGFGIWMLRRSRE